MEQLPLEMKVEVFYAMDDFSTLFNLIRASPSMYAIFASRKSLILSSVMKRALPIELLHIALWEKQWSLMVQRQHEGAESIVGKRLKTEPQSYPDPTSVAFASLARLQTVIEWLAQDLFKTVAVSESALMAVSSSLFLDEKIRIYRAFWHYQVFINIAHCLPDSGYNDQQQFLQSHYFKHLPNWEIEELANIHDNMLSKVASFELELRGAVLEPDHASMSHLACSGLNFCHTLFKKLQSTTQRINAVTLANRDNTNAERVRLRRFSKRFPSKDDLMKPRDVDYSDFLHRTNTYGPNRGLLWFSSMGTDNFFVRKDKICMGSSILRKQGYGLWSRRRLDHSDVMRQTKEAIQHPKPRNGQEQMNLARRSYSAIRDYQSQDSRKCRRSRQGHYSCRDPHNVIQSFQSPSMLAFFESDFQLLRYFAHIICILCMPALLSGLVTQATMKHG
ncbi:hypothetical protein MMC13_000137 [Lambiella insularis]|nr:hypothetical protein [Lambiella insularis]